MSHEADASISPELSAADRQTCGLHRRHSELGQAIVEFALALPMLLLVGLGVVEISYLLYDQHILIRLTREGSNLISRDATLYDSALAMKSMVNPPVDLTGNNSKLIFTVLTKVSSGANYNRVIVYQRHEVGGLAVSSAFRTQGTLNSSSFGPQPDYIAVNPTGDTSLRVTNVPSDLTLDQGQFIYVTEIFNRHALISCFSNFGVDIPTTLYSAAYF